MARYKMNDELSKWQVFKLVQVHKNKWILEEAPEIENIKCYNHGVCEAHHFVKYQRWERNPQKYNELQKIIVMPKIIHQHLESPVYGLSNEMFFNHYGIQKSELLYEE